MLHYFVYVLVNLGKLENFDKCRLYYACENSNKFANVVFMIVNERENTNTYKVYSMFEGFTTIFAN